jgi:hypothetical protein
VTPADSLPFHPLPRTPAVTGILETIAFFRDPAFAQKRFATYGDVFETTLLGQPTVFLRGEKPITDLFRQSDALEGWWPASVRELLGPLSLANRSGEAHRARRRIVGQLFTTAALKRYCPAMVGLVEELAGDLRLDPVDRPIAPLMRRFAFQVIATTVLGLGPDDRDALFLDFETWTRGLFSPPLAWPGSPLARARQARRRLLQRLEVVLRQAQQSAGRGEPLAAGGLDLLAGGLDELGVPLSDADVVEQLLLLLFAGYETTASSLSCLMLALLQHPDVHDWLQEELDTLRWPPAAEEAVTAYDANRAPRLDAVVKEVMRLTPPVGGFFRLTRAAITVAEMEIPAGRVVQASIAATHRLGSPGDDLERFRPRRHLEGGCSALLLPFGGGERVCLGKSLAELEIRLLTVGLLKKLRPGLVPDQDLSLMVVPSPTPRSGLRVNILSGLPAQGVGGLPAAH